MKYIGVIRSGFDIESDIAVGTEQIERKLPVMESVPYVSGSITNNGMNSMLVNFYMPLRETQSLVLHPNETYEVVNIPCQIFQLRGIGGITTCRYTFVMRNTTDDDENKTFLAFSDIKKKTSDNNTEPTQEEVARIYYPQLVGLDKGKEIGDTFGGYLTVEGNTPSAITRYYDATGTNYQLQLSRNELIVGKVTDPNAIDVTLWGIFPSVLWHRSIVDAQFDYIAFTSAFVPVAAVSSTQCASILGTNPSGYIQNNEPALGFKFQDGTWRFQWAHLATDVQEVNTNQRIINVVQYFKLYRDGTCDIRLTDQLGNVRYENTINTGILLHEQGNVGKIRWVLSSGAGESATAGLSGWSLRCN